MFSLLTYKSNVQKIFTKENFLNLCEFAKKMIVKYVDEENLLGADKKTNVDNAVIEYIAKYFVSNNTIVSFLVQLLIKFEPTLTQIIYELLKKKVDGLTE